MDDQLAVIRGGEREGGGVRRGRGRETKGEGRERGEGGDREGHIPHSVVY